MKKKYVIVNWKMNKNIEESKIWIENLLSTNIKKYNYNMIVCPPFTSLFAIKNIIKDDNKNLSLGAQNCHFEENGAFTGEISASMLNDLKVKYVIVGHSERRQFFLETNEIINKKIKNALKNNLNPILCLGESLSIREKGEETEFIVNQLKECLLGIDSKKIKNIIIAYEPILSIGTGKTISISDAEKIFNSIKDFLSEKYNKSISEEINIIYGGSLNLKNCNKFLNNKNIDGGLIGGASLDIENFIKILN